MYSILRKSLAFGFLVLGLSARAESYVVNLSNEPVYFASMIYSKPDSRPNGNVSVLAYVPGPEGWYTRAWKVLGPGEGESLPKDAYFRIEKMNGERPTWPDLENGRGMVPSNKTQYFEEFGSPGTYPQLSQRGFQWVDLQRARNAQGGTFRHGSNFVIREQKFPFAFGSRDLVSHRKDFPVPGFAFAINVRETQARFQREVVWSCQKGKVGMSVITEGARSNSGLFGVGQGRERSYYEGEVTVFYTERIGAGGGIPLTNQPQAVAGGLGSLRYANNYSDGMVMISLFHPASPKAETPFQVDAVGAASEMNVLRNGQSFAVGPDWLVKVTFGNGAASQLQRLDRAGRFDPTTRQWLVIASRVWDPNAK